MSELRPPTRWSADRSGDAPASFADAARGYRRDAPDSAARARMWEKLQKHVAAPVLRGWHMPWRGMSVLLVAGTSAMLALHALPSAHDPQPSAAAVVSESPPSAASDDHALIGARTEDAPVARDNNAPAASARVEEPPLPVSRQLPKRPRRGPTPAPPLPAASGDEVSMLVRARRLLQSQPARALELTEQHRTEHPQGTFTEERELLAIEALSQLGRREQVAARAQQFLAAYPSSAHRHRIEALRSAE